MIRSADIKYSAFGSQKILSLQINFIYYLIILKLLSKYNSEMLLAWFSKWYWQYSKNLRSKDPKHVQRDHSNWQRPTIIYNRSQINKNNSNTIWSRNKVVHKHQTPLRYCKLDEQNILLKLLGSDKQGGKYCPTGRAAGRRRTRIGAIH